MKIKKKSGSKTEILINLEAQPKRLDSYKKKKKRSVNRVLLLYKNHQKDISYQRTPNIDSRSHCMAQKVK